LVPNMPNMYRETSETRQSITGLKTEA
jgi:hypothetical protein